MKLMLITFIILLISCGKSAKIRLNTEQEITEVKEKLDLYFDKVEPLNIINGN